MVQILLPDSDVAAGSWTVTPLWSKVDDDSTVNPSGDGTIITSDAVGNNTQTSLADLKLASGGDPSASTGHILRARWNHDTAGRTMRATCELWQGVPGSGTLIASLIVDPDVGSTETESTYTLSGAEADSITDYSNLHLRLYGFGTGGGPSRSLVVDLVELETPDAAAVEINASGTFVAPSPSVAGLASVEVVADGTFQTSAPIASGVASVEVAADGTFDAPSPIISGTVSSTTEITANGTFLAPAHAVAGEASVEVGADGAFNSPSPTVSGTSEVEVGASGDVTAPSPAIAGSGSVEVAASGEVTAPGAVVRGSASLEVAAAGSFEAPSPVISGTASTTNLLNVLGTFDAPSHVITGLASVRIAIDGLVFSPAHTFSGAAAVAVAAAGGVIAPVASVAGLAGVEVAASGSVRAPMALISGTVSTGEEPFTPAFSIGTTYGALEVKTALVPITVKTKVK